MMRPTSHHVVGETRAKPFGSFCTGRGSLLHYPNDAPKTLRANLGPLREKKATFVNYLGPSRPIC
jgi:hypothetical protein